MVDKNLFIYITKRSGHTMRDVAHALDMAESSLSRRLSGEIPFRVPEIETWMRLTGTDDAGPVFFPLSVARAQQQGGDANGENT